MKRKIARDYILTKKDVLDAVLMWTSREGHPVPTAAAKVEFTLGPNGAGLIWEEEISDEDEPTEEMKIAAFAHKSLGAKLKAHQ